MVGWTVILILIGLGLLAVDIFLPSGGILLGLSATCFVISVVLGFAIDTTVGVALLGGETVLLMVLGYAFVKIWPKTKFGRRFLIVPDPDAHKADPYVHLKELVGRRGRAKTKMLPAGMIVVESQTYDAVSAGQPIEVGQTIEIVAIDAGKIVVRPSMGRLEEPKDAPLANDEPTFEDPFGE